jgi:hypothetical protein
VLAQRESQPVGAVSKVRIPEPDSEWSAYAGACPDKLGVQKLLLRCEVFELERVKTCHFNPPIRDFRFVRDNH